MPYTEDIALEPALSARFTFTTSLSTHRSFSKATQALVYAGPAAKAADLRPF